METNEDLRRRREAAHTPCRVMAKALDVSPETLRSWELGRRKPSEADGKRWVACVRLAEACHYAAAAHAYGIPEPADALRQYATEEALIR